MAFCRKKDSDKPITSCANSVNSDHLVVINSWRTTDKNLENVKIGGSMDQLLFVFFLLYVTVPVITRLVGGKVNATFLALGLMQGTSLLCKNIMPECANNYATMTHNIHMTLSRHSSLFRPFIARSESHRPLWTLAGPEKPSRGRRICGRLRWLVPSST